VAVRSIRRVEGFHGTTVSNAEDILDGGFTLSRNDYDWLGKGVYFFEDAPRTAKSWAERQCKQSEGEPAVLHSVIDLTSCMNLLDTAWNDRLETVYEQYARLFEEDLPVNDGGFRELDCDVIDYACYYHKEQYGRPIQSVRAVFHEVDDEELFPGSHIQKRSHLQIAVRDPSVISETRLWEPEGDDPRGWHLF
jgi:hypothetical protein